MLAIALAVLFPTALQSQELATLHGVIRDSHGKLVVGATVHLHLRDADQNQTVQSGSDGGYTFAALRSGVYDLRVAMASYADGTISALFVSPRENKVVDLTLTSAPTADKAPEFFDPPQFAVSGVTDATSLGGHGSGVVNHTRETIAREAASLGGVLPGAALSGSRATSTPEAEKKLRDEIGREPGSFELNHRLGRLLVESGRGREALPFLDHAAELRPDDYENSYDQAWANLQAGNAASTRDRVRALLAKSDKPDLHHLLAEADETLGDSLAAVAEYQRAAELGRREAYFFDWGSELLRHHAAEPATEIFSKGSGLFPQSARMQIGLAAAWFARGSYDLAVERICAASDLDPNDAIPYIFMGKMQAAERAPSEKILERLRRFHALQPDNAAGSYYYASALWKSRSGLQDKDKATAAQVESLLEHAIQLDASLAAAYLQLGILHAEQKNYRQAISDFQSAIQADPHAPIAEAHYRLAQVYGQIGNSTAAKAELQTYQDLTKQSEEQEERERRAIPQFVYELRSEPPE